MADWDSSVLSGPEGEDWRVPVSELEQRLNALANALQASSLPGVIIQDLPETFHNVVLIGDARENPLPDNCVQLVVTSPPYNASKAYDED